MPRAHSLMRSRAHQTTSNVETEKLVLTALISLIGMTIAYSVRKSRRTLQRDGVLDKLSALNSINGVVYDQEELFENVLSFNVPISVAVGQNNVDLSALDDAIRSVGGRLVGIANSSEPNTRNLSVRLPKNGETSCFMQVMSAAISLFSVAGLTYVAWAVSCDASFGEKTRSPGGACGG